MHSSVIQIQDYYEDENWHPFLQVIRTHNSRKETIADDVLETLEGMDTPDKWSREDVITCFKEMRELGFAKMTKGVKSKKTRLEWLFPPRAIADAAIGKTDELEQLIAGQPIEVPAVEDGRYKGKANWSLEDLQDVLSRVTGLSAKEIRVRLTIPEARKILADDQGITIDEVTIRMG